MQLRIDRSLQRSHHRPTEQTRLALRWLQSLRSNSTSRHGLHGMMTPAVQQCSATTRRPTKIVGRARVLFCDVSCAAGGHSATPRHQLQYPHPTSAAFLLQSSYCSNSSARLKSSRDESVSAQTAKMVVFSRPSRRFAAEDIRVGAVIGDAEHAIVHRCRTRSRTAGIAPGNCIAGETANVGAAGKLCLWGGSTPPLFPPARSRTCSRPESRDAIAAVAAQLQDAGAPTNAATVATAGLVKRARIPTICVLFYHNELYCMVAQMQAHGQGHTQASTTGLVTMLPLATARRNAGAILGWR